ncbi:MAG: DUF2752 domain-containing protein [Bifidobacteriaceae bacterium]|jgi:hypothetical protein|nr:DUF2752 domain-containing protein [Bifidobacteriaceae bacterium]
MLGTVATSRPVQAIAARWPRWAAPAAVGLLAATGLALLAAVDPNEPGHYPTCPSLWLTGLYCPGCGSLRALHALTRLDFAGAAQMNPALLVALPYVVWAWGRWLWSSLDLGPPRRWLAPAWVIWTVLTLVMAYWLLRNIPALAPWLAPAGVVAPALT